MIGPYPFNTECPSCRAADAVVFHDGQGEKLTCTACGYAVWGLSAGTFARRAHEQGHR